MTTIASALVFGFGLSCLLLAAGVAAEVRADGAAVSELIHHRAKTLARMRRGSSMKGAHVIAAMEFERASTISAADIERVLFELGISTHAFQEVMAMARAGDIGWWDRLKKAVSQGLDKLNVAKWWECNRCKKCKKLASNFQERLAKYFMDHIGGGITGGALCAATIDPAALALCTVMTSAIPVPGATPVICTAFTAYVHSKCTSFVLAGIVAFTKQLVALMPKLKAKTFTAIDVDGIAGFAKDKICTDMGLCPLTRDDCHVPIDSHDCYKDPKDTSPHPQLYIPAIGDCDRTTFLSCSTDDECAPVSLDDGGCTGRCMCTDSFFAMCRCMQPAKTGFKCATFENGDAKIELLKGDRTTASKLQEANVIAQQAKKILGMLG